MTLHNRNVNSAEPFLYLATKADASYKIGQLLQVNSAGEFVTATTSPTHLAVGEVTGATGVTVPAILVLPDMTFEATLTADGAALKVGNKVTLSADGQNVTATTTAGVAEIVSFLSDTQGVGGRVAVKFS